MKLSKDRDLYYKALRKKYLEACVLINFLSKMQAEIRAELKKCADPIERKFLRHRLAENRRGPRGLRSLNKAIATFYRYCEDKGY